MGTTIRPEHGDTSHTLCYYPAEEVAVIPEPNADGNLPPGVHQARWPEVAARFGGTAARRRLLSGLAEGLRLLAAAGCRCVWLDGSFIAASEATLGREPRDFDACWHIAGVDLPRLALLAEEFFEFRPGHPRQKRRWGGEFFPVGGPVPPGGIDQVEYFQTDRAGTAKGIVLLQLDSAMVADLEGFLEEGAHDHE